MQPRQIQHARDLAANYPPDAVLELPELNQAEEEKVVRLIGDQSRFHTSISRQVGVSPNNWHKVGQRNGFSIWQLHIRSREAKGIRVWFSEFELYDGMLAKVYGPEDHSFIHEYVGGGLFDATRFWSLLIPGNTLIVEIWTPSSSILSPVDFPLKIRWLNHHFRSDTDGIQPLQKYSAGSAQSHSSCPFRNKQCVLAPGGVDLTRGVARITYTPPPGRGSGGQCTAGLLASRGSGESTGDGFYLMTAYHCIKEGSHPEMAKGTIIAGIDIAIGDSACIPAEEIISGQGARFIAGHETGDYALLWVERSDLAAATTSTYLALGWDTRLQPNGSRLEMLHHGEGTDQNYALVQIEGIWHAADIMPDSTTFESCVQRDNFGCSHYALHLEQGGFRPGSSGTPAWTPDTKLVTGIYTHRAENTCDGFASRFTKVFEDGRVNCALNVVDKTNCDDAGRPFYSNRSPARNSGSGSGGGAMGIAWLALLAGAVMLSYSGRVRKGTYRASPSLGAK